MRNLSFRTVTALLVLFSTITISNSLLALDKSTCSDTDGNNIFKKGVARERQDDRVLVYKDFCDFFSGKEVQREGVCIDGRGQYINRPCPENYTCSDGACILQKK